MLVNISSINIFVFLHNESSTLFTYYMTKPYKGKRKGLRKTNDIKIYCTNI